MSDRQRTHWEGCEESHHDCALAKLTACRERLERAEAALRDATLGLHEGRQLAEWTVKHAAAIAAAQEKKP